MAMRLTPWALAALAVACSVNPLDPDKKGCIEIRGLGNTCDNAAESTQSACQTACGNAQQCSVLGKLGYDSTDACIVACNGGAFDGTLVDCMANLQNCDGAAVCLGEQAGDEVLCQTACTYLGQCVDLSQTALGSVQGCITECETNNAGAQCIVDSGGDCQGVGACLQ